MEKDERGEKVIDYHRFLICKNFCAVIFNVFLIEISFSPFFFVLFLFWINLLISFWSSRGLQGELIQWTQLIKGTPHLIRSVPKIHLSSIFDIKLCILDRPRPPIAMVFAISKFVCSSFSLRIDIESVSRWWLVLDNGFQSIPARLPTGVGGLRRFLFARFFWTSLGRKMKKKKCQRLVFGFEVLPNVWPVSRCVHEFKDQFAHTHNGGIVMMHISTKTFFAEKDSIVGNDLTKRGRRENFDGRKQKQKKSRSI